MQNLRFITIWEAKRVSNTHIKYHAHKYHELVYYASGSGKTEIDCKAFTFSDYSFAVIPRHAEHNETHLIDAEVICLGFFADGDLPFGFYRDTNHLIYQILTELLSEVKNQKYGYADMITIKLHELLLHIIRSKNSTSATKNFSYMIDYIRENFHERINLSDCARQLNISYDYFQHKFKTLTGFSPQQFLIEQRLLACLDLLTKSEFNCTEIAHRCGFSTSAQFSALFKKRYGMTPLQYKKQHI